MDRPAPHGVSPGDLVGGKYRLERVLGAGGMGVVWSATHAGLGSSVAVKLLRDERARSPDAVERFVREARVTANLTSQHIARVTDVGECPIGGPYLVMELLAGRDLAAE